MLQHTDHFPQAVPFKPDLSANVLSLRTLLKLSPETYCSTIISSSGFSLGKFNIPRSPYQGVIILSEPQGCDV